MNYSVFPQLQNTSLVTSLYSQCLSRPKAQSHLVPFKLNAIIIDIQSATMLRMVMFVCTSNVFFVLKFPSSAAEAEVKS